MIVAIILIVIVAPIYAIWGLREPEKFKGDFESINFVYHIDGLGLQPKETVGIKFIGDDLDLRTGDTVFKLDFKKVNNYRMSTVQTIMNEQNISRAVKGGFWFGHAGVVAGSVSQDVIKHTPVFIFEYESEDGLIEIALSERPDNNTGTLNLLHRSMNFKRGIIEGEDVEVKEIRL